MSPLSPQEVDILRAAYFDGTLRVHEGLILAVKSNVGFRGVDATRAFRSLRARSCLSWSGHSVVGGELYDITERGRKAFEETRPKK